MAPHRNVAAEFGDHPGEGGDVVGDEVDDEGLGGGAEVELARGGERHRVALAVEVDSAESERRHRRVHDAVTASGEFVVVAVVAEGEQRGQHGRVAQTSGRLAGA